MSTPFVSPVLCIAKGSPINQPAIILEDEIRARSLEPKHLCFHQQLSLAKNTEPKSPQDY